MGISRKKQHAINVNPNRVEKLKEVGIVYAESNKQKQNTVAVQKMREILTSYGIPFISEHPVVVKYSSHYKDSKLYILDFYLPKPFNLIIEVDGGYHNSPEQKAYDKRRDNILKLKGTGSTLRFTNEQVLSNEFDLRSFLSKSARKAIDYYNSMIDFTPDERFKEEYETFYSLNKTQRKVFFFGVIAEALKINWEPYLLINKSTLRFRPPHKKGNIDVFTYNPATDIATEHRRGMKIPNAFKWVVTNSFNYQIVN